MTDKRCSREEVIVLEEEEPKSAYGGQEDDEDEDVDEESDEEELVAGKNGATDEAELSACWAQESVEKFMVLLGEDVGE